jgi:hypothetical protein
VTINNPPASPDPYSGDSNAVEAIIKVKHPTFFEKAFGIGSVFVTTRAVARLGGASPPCIYLLNPAGTNNFNSATINAQCGIMDNETGSPNMRGATITAGIIGYAGSAPNENSAHFPSATPQPAVPASDPCIDILGCRYIKNNPPAATGCGSLAQYSGTIPPGCYNSLDIHGGNVTFSGFYILNGSGTTLNASNATMNTGPSGATFYITSNGCPSNCPQLNLDKATMSLSPPTSGDYSEYSQGEQGVLFYQDPANTSDPNFNKGTGVALTGVLYFPTSAVNFNKTGGGYVTLIFGSVNFNGNTLTFPPPPGGVNNLTVQKPALVE